MQHVVRAPEYVRALNRDHIERFLHHANPRPVACQVGANRAFGLLTDVGAGVTQDDPVFHGQDRFRQFLGFLARHAYQEVRETLRALGADTG